MVCFKNINQNDLPALKWTYNGGQKKTGSENVDCLWEMLNDVAPDETDDPEENDNDPGEVLGPCLTVKILQKQKSKIIFQSFTYLIQDDDDLLSKVLFMVRPDWHLHFFNLSSIKNTLKGIN